MYLTEWKLMRLVSNYLKTLKDHKENFDNQPTITLIIINATKNEIQIINELMLNKINVCLCKKLKLGDWKTITANINCFEKDWQESPISVHFIRYERLLPFHKRKFNEKY